MTTTTCSCSLADAFRDQFFKSWAVLVGSLVVIFVFILPILSWTKDKIINSWKTLVWASIGVGMLAVAMTAHELQDRVILIIKALLGSLDNQGGGGDILNNLATRIDRFLKGS